jgi:hypothetical protein
MGEHPLPPPDGDEPQHLPVSEPRGAHGGPSDGQNGEHEQRQQDRVQHGEHTGGGNEPDEIGAELDGPVDKLLSGADAAVAGPLHGVAPAGVVERGQIDPGGEFEQPHLGGLVDLGRQAPIGHGGGRGEHTPNGKHDHKQNQRGYGGPHAIGCGPFPQQPVKNPDNADEPDRTGHTGGELQGDNGASGPRTGTPGERPGGAEKPGQPPEHPQKRGVGGLLGAGQPVGKSKLPVVGQLPTRVRIAGGPGYAGFCPRGRACTG